MRFGQTTAKAVREIKQESERPEKTERLFIKTCPFETFLTDPPETHINSSWHFPHLSLFAIPDNSHSCLISVRFGLSHLPEMENICREKFSQNMLIFPNRYYSVRAINIFPDTVTGELLTVLNNC
jgi:hypothetical protein